MAEEDHESRETTSFHVNWSSSNLSPNSPINTAELSNTGRGFSYQTTPEYGGQFSSKVLPSRLKLRSMASAKFSPLGLNYMGEKKLRDAVQQAKVDTLFQLLNQGVNVCAADSKRRTALHFAAAQGNEQTLQILLENGANPNAKDLNGNTPLHLAACTNQLKIVTLLLEAGASANAADFSGKTPLDLAYSRLKVLHGDENIREQPSIYCEEVKQVIALIKAYMLRLGNQEVEETLDNMSSMLGKSTTTKEVEEVHDLLASFTAMNLSQSGGKDII